MRNCVQFVKLENGRKTTGKLHEHLEESKRLTREVEKQVQLHGMRLFSTLTFERTIRRQQ